MDLKILVPERVLTVEGFLTPEECRQYIALSEGEGYEAAPITTAQGFVHRPDIRNNERVILDDLDLAARLYERIAPMVPSPLNGRAAVGLNERFRFYRYDVDQRFAPHFDGAYRRENGQASQVTFMVYLNDDFSGGATNFDLPQPYGHLSVVPREGMALLFYHRLLHEGAPVVSGRKYVLRSDVMYGPVAL